MAITTLDGYIAAAKQNLAWMKTAARTTVTGGNWAGMLDVVGNPGAGVLAGTSTTVGVVPTDATAGFPIINFSTGTGYLSNVDFGNTVACRIQISDNLFKAGAYGFAAGTTSLATQPSYSSRVPSGTDYTGTQIWIEVSTAFATGTAWQVQVTYTNQAGTAARTSIISAAQAAAALILGKRFQIALQAGDTGVQKIESVIVTNGGTAMTAGNFNVLVLRPLTTHRVRLVNDGDVHALDKTGMPVVYLDSALDVMICPDTTSTGVPELLIEVANG